MKNKCLAIFGITAYILSVISSATNTSGNLIMPVTLIIISGIATIVFIVMTSIRLWHGAKIESVLLAISFTISSVLYFVEDLTLTPNGSLLILLTNISRVIYFISLVWAICLLWTRVKYEEKLKN